jgi:hypothetical protein
MLSLRSRRPVVSGPTPPSPGPRPVRRAAVWQLTHAGRRAGSSSRQSVRRRRAPGTTPRLRRTFLPASRVMRPLSLQTSRQRAREFGRDRSSRAQRRVRRRSPSTRVETTGAPRRNLTPPSPTGTRLGSRMGSAVHLRRREVARGLEEVACVPASRRDQEFRPDVACLGGRSISFSLPRVVEIATLRCGARRSSDRE